MVGTEAPSAAEPQDPTTNSKGAFGRPPRLTPPHRVAGTPPPAPAAPRPARAPTIRVVRAMILPAWGTNPRPTWGLPYGAASGAGEKGMVVSTIPLSIPGDVARGACNIPEIPGSSGFLRLRGRNELGS